MKSLFNTINFFGFFIILNSCGSETATTENQITTDTTNIESEHQEHTDSIHLNKGEKWKMDEHMLAFIRTMEKDVADFSNEAGEKILTNYGLLSDKLTANLDSLTSNCTMTGQAHDELHKWLLPFMDLNDNLSFSETVQEADSLYSEIKKSFSEFNTYFE